MQLFNLVALAIAYELEQGFPTVENLKFGSLRLLTSLDAETIEACEEIFVDSMRWLRDQGFIEYSSATLDGNFFLISLTEKGCSRLLNTVPAVAGRGESTVGKTLQELARTGVATVTEQVIVAVSRTFLGGA
jgi:hypothetical protein